MFQLVVSKLNFKVFDLLFSDEGSIGSQHWLILHHYKYWILVLSYILKNFWFIKLPFKMDFSSWLQDFFFHNHFCSVLLAFEWDFQELSKYSLALLLCHMGTAVLRFPFVWSPEAKQHEECGGDQSWKKLSFYALGPEKECVLVTLLWCIFILFEVKNTFIKMQNPHKYPNLQFHAL